ncbi:MAG: hypothetical protein ACXW3S_01435 [Rhodoplanes sp.]
MTGATIGALTCPTPVLAQSAGREAPFGDRAGSLAVNYTRIKPHIATAGVLKNGAAQGLKALGFATIVHLRGPTKGLRSKRRSSKRLACATSIFR